jgi:hypothetical protein
MEPRAVEAPLPKPSSQRRGTRAIALVLWVMGCSYVPVFASSVLHGDWRGFFRGFGQVPWGQPLVIVLTAMAIVSTAVGLAARALLLRRAKAAATPQGRLALELVGMVAGMALLESAGVFGLTLGFAMGPPLASLTGLLLLVPVLGMPFLLPPHARFGASEESAIHPA